MTDPESLYARIQDRLRGLNSVLVAFSGGIDSSVVLAATCRAMGCNAVIAVTGISETYTAAEAQLARDFCAALGVEQVILETEELSSEAFSANRPDRCYHCKSELFEKIEALRVDRRADAILDGSNKDDDGDYRPGRKAAREHGVLSPLQEAGLTKTEVRELARHWSIPAPDRPANPCLASRIPYGTRITGRALDQVERGERLLHELGFVNVRVRHHGLVARVELEPDEISRALDPDLRRAISVGLKEVGYKWVALDLEGYRTGSLNEILLSSGSAA